MIGYCRRPCPLPATASTNTHLSHRWSPTDLTNIRWEPVCSQGPAIERAWGLKMNRVKSPQPRKRIQWPPSLTENTAPAVWGPCPQQPTAGKARKMRAHSGLKAPLPCAAGWWRAAVVFTPVQRSVRPGNNWWLQDWGSVNRKVLLTLVFSWAPEGKRRDQGKVYLS